METLKEDMRQVLEENILRYWLTQMVDREHGGFYGRRDACDRLWPDAPKAAVLNARILWAFAAAYRVLGRDEYRLAALRAKNYILDHFIDRQEGGVYWMLDSEGCPLDTKKQTYAIGFTIYGLSEFYRATGDEQALQEALRLYHDVERHAYDPVSGGYIEALTRQWGPIGDMRLSEKDENGSRTMNTHLHILEPYTNLLRCLSGAGQGRTAIGTEEDARRLRASLRNLISIFTTRIQNPENGHLDLFFDDQWRGRRDIVSYGHDIEAAWLLTEALEVLGDEGLTRQTMSLVRRLALAAEEGLQPSGALLNERRKGEDGAAEDAMFVWWVQCECIIGLVDQWQHFSDAEALERAHRCWTFTREHLIDWEHGEWYWSAKADGTRNLEEDKAGPWKCPYHNARLCLEVIERAQRERA